MTAYIIDTETTGQIEPIQVIQLATKGVDPETLLFEETTLVVNYEPSKPIEFGAMAVHHIMEADLKGHGPSSGARLPSDCTHIIGHGVDYDWSALGKPKVKRICTLTMSRELWPDKDSHSLSAMIYRIFGAEKRELVKMAHGAGADVRMCALLLSAILDELDCANIEELWQESELYRIPSVMPFGKHKGMEIAKIPAGYKRWLLDQPDVDEYLLKALRGI